MRVGLTGGVASGKSTVSALLAEHGAVVIDADLLAREVVAPGTEGLAEIVAAFGDGVLTPDGGLDRPAMGAIVFADEQKRRTLEAIIHPRVRARGRELEEAAGSGRAGRARHPAAGRDRAARQVRRGRRGRRTPRSSRSSG